MSLHELDKRVLILLIGQTYESMSIEELRVVKENTDKAYEEKRVKHNRNNILEKTKDWDHREFVLEHLDTLSLIKKVQTYHERDEFDGRFVRRIFILYNGIEEIRMEFNDYRDRIVLKCEFQNNTDRRFLVGLKAYHRKLHIMKQIDFMQKLSAILNENY